MQAENPKMCDEYYRDIIIEEPQPVLMLYILQPPLVQACFHRNPDEVRSLLQQKAEVNFQVFKFFILLCWMISTVSKLFFFLLLSYIFYLYLSFSLTSLPTCNHPQSFLPLPATFIFFFLHPFPCRWLSFSILALFSLFSIFSFSYVLTTQVFFFILI